MSTVLLIHADGQFLAAHQALLEKFGFQILTASNGSDAMHKIYHHFPDLVVADIMLPEINGYQICRLLKNDPITKRIPFVLISDFAEKMEKFWGIKAGADLFLHYNELEAKLVRHVRVLLDMYEQVDPAEKRRLIQNADRHSYNTATRLNQILDKALIESTLMIDFRNLVDLAYDVNLLNHMLFSFIEDILDYDAAAIFYNDKCKAPRLLTLHFPEDRLQNLNQANVMQEQFFARLPAQYLESQPFQMRDLDLIGDVSEEHPVQDYQTVYFKEFFYNNELIGAMAFYAVDKIDYAKIFPMSLIEEEIALLMKVRHVFSQAELLAVTDGLTGLVNYNQFMMTLDREFKAAKRYEHALSVAIIDIDNFKEYNAQWGYLQGDEVLKSVAQEADKTFRAVDVVARMGGEELVVLFPKTDQEHAMLALERFRQNISQLKALSPVTVSIGLASLEPGMEDVSNILRRARQALETASHEGANRISLGQPAT